MRDSWPLVDREAVGWLDTSQMIEVDRVMIEDLHIELIQMMENAGRNLARLTMSLHGPEAVTVYAGSGGNGGGGLVAARHLANLGVETAVVLARAPDELGPVPAHQLDILRRLGLPIVDPSGPPSRPEGSGATVAIDALIGYSLRGAPTGRTAELIEAVGRHDRVVALDVPSGLDATTGATPGAAVTAGATLTLALPKVGLRQSPTVGRLFVGDISVPPSVYGPLGVDSAGLPPFELAPILELVPSGE